MVWVIFWVCTIWQWLHWCSLSDIQYIHFCGAIDIFVIFNNNNYIDMFKVIFGYAQYKHLHWCGLGNSLEVFNCDISTKVITQYFSHVQLQQWDWIWFSWYFGHFSHWISYCHMVEVANNNWEILMLNFKLNQNEPSNQSERKLENFTCREHI
jgi:hypothetical protein